MRRKRSNIILFILVVLIVLGYFLAKPAFNYLSGYLSKSDQVKANILVVEGWLPDYALEMAFKEFHKTRYEYIVTTGLKDLSEYYMLSRNGYLIFYTKNRFVHSNESIKHFFEIDAYSEMRGKNSAHFNLFVNNKQIGDFYAKKYKKLFSAAWIGILKDIDSVSVEYTNDLNGDFGDRNLYVKDVIIDHKTKIPFHNNSTFEFEGWDSKERISNNFDSYAEFARKRLMSMGIDSTLIISISANGVKINRTLTSALAFRDWINLTNININGINIISLGTHARRTWMTYNKVLDEKYPIGIISLPDYNNNHSRTIRFFKTIREILGIMYYWFILIPY